MLPTSCVSRLQASERNDARRGAPTDGVLRLHCHRPVRDVVGRETRRQRRSRHRLRERAGAVAAGDRDPVLINRAVAGNLGLPDIFGYSVAGRAQAAEQILSLRRIVAERPHPHGPLRRLEGQIEIVLRVSVRSQADLVCSAGFDLGILAGLFVLINPSFSRLVN